MQELERKKVGQFCARTAGEVLNKLIGGSVGKRRREREEKGIPRTSRNLLGVARVVNTTNFTHTQRQLRAGSGNLQACMPILHKLVEVQCRTELACT